MKSDNPFTNFDFAKILNEFRLPQLDAEQLLAAHKRNIDAVNRANTLAFEGLQSLARRQTELMSQTIQEVRRATEEISSAGAPEDKIAKQAEITKRGFENALAAARELAEMMARSQNEALDVINQRIAGALDEFRSAVSSKGAPGNASSGNKSGVRIAENKK
ncbi:MAG: TIGR01841 family phasin [Alphaproteobacteria bacterium]